MHILRKSMTKQLTSPLPLVLLLHNDYMRKSHQFSPHDQTRHQDITCSSNRQDYKISRLLDAKSFICRKKKKEQANYYCRRSKMWNSINTFGP